jgi:hypothetical protein
MRSQHLKLLECARTSALPLAAVKHALATVIVATRAGPTGIAQFVKGWIGEMAGRLAAMGRILARGGMSTGRGILMAIRDENEVPRSGIDEVLGSLVMVTDCMTRTAVANICCEGDPTSQHLAEGRR